MSSSVPDRAAGDGRRRRGPTRRFLRLAAVTVLTVLATLAVAGVPAASADGAPGGRDAAGRGRCRSTAVGGDQTVTVDGSAVPVHLPAGYRGDRVPLVLDLHGSSSDGLAQMAGDGIRALADREGFAVAAPDGAVPFSPAPGFVGFAWNIPGVPLVGTTVYPPTGARDDVQFVAHVIDAVSSLACIDTRRVYATGVSGGGRMASQLACDLPDRIAAIAPISGVRFPLATDTPPSTVTCAPGRAVPVIAIHGVWDPVNAFADTPPPEAATLPAAIAPPVPGSSWTYSAQTAVARWAANNGCKDEPRVRAETPNIDVVSYRACHAGADVVLYELKDSGHASPGHGIAALDSLLNPTNDEVDGTVVAWQFLSAHHLK
jgi:polyhydroxybutyrate depolymerase